MKNSFGKESKITVVGKHSGVECVIDVSVLSNMVKWYVQDAPREARTIENIEEIVHTSDSLLEVVRCEYSAAKDKIDKKLTGEIMDRELEKSHE